MFIARQPIFDRSMKVYGYELLFRSEENAIAYGGSTAENSTASVLGGLFELGLTKLVGGKRAFINFDYSFLQSDTIELINPDSLVIEILEHTNSDEKILNRIMDLKRMGYKIALDDFAENAVNYPIVPISDIIKYDLIETPLDTLHKDIKYVLGENKIILAEKIETEEDYVKAKKMGFHLFQGFFFSKPKIVGGVKKRFTTNAVYNRILSELHKEEPSFVKLAEIIESDVSMAYKVLRLLTQKKGEAESSTIKRAITRIGLIELERWINVLMLQEISAKKPSELIRLALVRAKFGELIAAKSDFSSRKYEISLMFLFSVLDAMLDQTMEEALEGVSVSEEVKSALINQEGPLKPIYEVVQSYENGDWDNINRISKEILLDKGEIFSCYIDAIKWASDIMKEIWER